MKLPIEPRLDDSPLFSEEESLSKMAKFKGHSHLPELYRAFKLNNKSLSEGRRQRLLACWLHYTQMDTDADGTPDWTPIVDGRLSTILYPFDEDMDGDGYANMLDPDPLDAKVKGQKADVRVPAHLAIQGGNQALQKRLAEEFGILAVNHSDEHSQLVLEQLLVLLKDGLPAKFISSLRLKYIYAFAGHDSRHNIAGYHHHAQALSIGGRKTYDGKSFLRPNILNSLAHEIGHAFLLTHMSVEEVSRVAEAYGGWGDLLRRLSPANLFAAAFFLPHPWRSSPAGASDAACVASNYGMSNVHEWFADCFADYTMDKLRAKGRLAEGWPRRASGPFALWLEQRLSESQSH